MKESIIRTVVPIVYALLIRLGLGAIGVDDALLQNLATAIVTGIIYAVIRYVETHKSAFGWLLGSPTAPSYSE